MRELILKRIEEMRTNTGGFPSTVQRWRDFSHGTEKKHLNQIEFDKLEDADLLFLFERLVRRYNTQM